MGALLAIPRREGADGEQSDSTVAEVGADGVWSEATLAERDGGGSLAADAWLLLL